MNFPTDYIFERDRQEFSFGDTLDIKTSVILAVIACLAALSAALFKNAGGVVTVLETASLVLLSCGAVASVVELWPRDYKQEDSPESYDAWLKDLEKFYSHEKEAVANEFMRGRAQRAKERISNNEAMNNGKARAMRAAFYFTAGSLFANLIVLFMLLS